jgi:hypothetical protein
VAGTKLFIPFGSYDEAERLTATHVPEGDYLVRIKKVEDTKVKNGPNAGTPGFILWYEVQGGEFAGALLSDRQYVMDSTLWKLSWFLRTVGIKVTKKDMTLPIDQLVGRQLKITVKEGEPYKGNPRNEISAYNPAPRSNQAEVETETFAADELPNPWDETEVKAADLPADKADEILGGAVRSDYADDWALDNSVTI